ncbi:hypothetical protein [Streptomyces sp. NRRL WC-3549]|uniref:hypothetical protein n=1 Tax=Streptomyces sp. NRRL WC-3549 TaxID=1463925 RepID=UPI0004C87EAE|nr:hypothetical protein [Streptomyces sp. NRRL WC-3549]
MSFLDPHSAPEADADIDPASFDAEDTELVSLAEQLRTQLEEIDGKRADISKRRTEAGPSRAQIRTELMDSLHLFDDEDDPMPAGIKRILDSHAKGWQRKYRELAKENKLPQASQHEQFAGTGYTFNGVMGRDVMKEVTQEVDAWLSDRANSRNRKGAGAGGHGGALAERLYEQTRTGRY